MPNPKEIAKLLLQKEVVTLNLKEPYTYASGIRSPIYCDNRKMIAFFEEREIIVEAFIDILKELESAEERKNEFKLINGESRLIYSTEE